MKNTGYRVTNRIILFVVCLFLSLSSALGQSTSRTRYVKPTATGTMDGTSWANAMTLQAALDGHMSGDLLYLMRGSYTPTAKKADGMAVAMGQERDATYILPSGVTLYGGFAGTEASHTARDMDEIHDDNATTIEGDIGTMRTTMAANNTDNIQRLFILANDGTATLDGLVVARAYLDGTNNGAGLSGGTGVNITLRHCRFIGNTAHIGGAVRVNAGGTLAVTNSTFEGNSARVGGGGAIAVSAGSTLRATGSTFRLNQAADGQSGSAIFLFSTAANASTGTISRCSFFENSATGADSFGTVYVDLGSTLDVSSSVFARNTMGLGTALYSSGSGTFINNTVYGNTDRTTTGGAVSFFTNTSTWVVANNIIYGNTGGTHQLRFDATAPSKTMAHNLIEGNSIKNGPTRIGALTAPATAAELFASTTATDADYLRLLPGVAAIDGGNNDYIDGNGTTAYETSQGVAIKDRTGENRVRNMRVDVGAYEFSPPRVRYVKATATGTMDGTSWANAMTLQAALDGYMSRDLLYLMSGSYTPTAKKSDGMAVAMGEERDATYVLPSGITIYGGFAGTEASHTARDMDEIHDDNATIIEGDIGTMRTETEANNTDNIKRLFTVANNGIATLDGLVVARAHLDGNNGGGGILGGTGTNITLRLCRFIGNTAHSGGAVRVNAGGTLAVTNSTFEGNSSRGGGGAISMSSGGTFMVTGSTFRENTAGDGQNGSAISLFSTTTNASMGTISRCSFFENSAPGNSSTGAVYVLNGSTLHVSNSVFAGNTMGVGAAVYSSGAGGTFINNTVYGSTNRDNRDAAVYLDISASTWVVANNIIYGNTGTHQLRFEGAANKTMAHNLIEGNSIRNGPTRIGALTAPATAAELFASTTATNASYLRLLLGVAAINGGNNAYIDGDGSSAYVATQGTAIKDRLGNARVFGATVDVGAYEFRGSSITLTSVPADLSNLSNEEGTITVSVVLGGFADDYTVNLDKATFTTSSVVDGVLTLSYSANMTTSVREDTVAFSTTSTMGGEIPARDSLFLRQMASVPQTVGLTPDNLMDVPAVGGTRTVMLTLGGGATSYMTSGAADWVTVPATGMAGEVSLNLDANTTTSARQSMVTFTPTGGIGPATPTTLMINQLGVGPSVTLTPPSLDDVPAMGGIRTVMLTLGGDATGYTTSGAADWVTVPAMGMAGEVSLTLDANTTTSARQSMVIFTPTGGTGEATTATLMISQLGALPAGPSVTLTPSSVDDVPAMGGTRTVMLTLGGDATGYTTSGAADWVTVPAMGMAGEVSLTLDANMSTSARQSTVTFTPTGGTGEATTATLMISQLGALPAGPSVTLTPSSLDDVPAMGGIRTVMLTLGGGATGYTTSGGADWVTVPAMGMAGEVSLTLDANTATSARQSRVTFTPTGGTGEATTATLMISQLGTLPSGPRVTLSPDRITGIPALGGMRRVTATFTGGANGYTVPMTGIGAPASWVTVPAMATSSTGVLNITIEANTMTTERKDTVIFTPTGGMGTAIDDSLFITQLGTASVAISVTSVPTDLNRLPAAGGRVTATITLSGEASGWLVMVPRSGFTMSSAASGAGGGTATLTYAANTTTAVRKDTVVFSTTGGTGTARDTLVLEQLAATTLSFSVSEGVFADVRVVNPTSDELVIYGIAKEVGLLLRDVLGREVFSGSLPLGGQRVPLPPLARGVYVLVLRDENGQSHHVRLLRE